MATFSFPDEDNDGTTTEDDKKLKAGDDDGPEIEIVDDTPERDRGRPALEKPVGDPTDEELQTYSEKVQTRIKELTHARHDERRQREKLERERAEMERIAQTLIDENRNLRGVVDNGSKQYISTATKMADNAVEQARQELRAAQEVFDTDAIMTAQDKLLDAKINAAEAKKMRPTTLQAEEPVVQQRQRASESDQTDARTLDWQAQNQWFGADGNEEYTSFALGLHQKLIRSGYDPRGDAYFEQIDTRMKSVFPELYGAGRTQVQANSSSSRKPNSVVAPTSRSTGTRKVQLTATQVALAAKFGLTPSQYAAELVKLEK